MRSPCTAAIMKNATRWPGASGRGWLPAGNIGDLRIAANNRLSAHHREVLTMFVLLAPRVRLPSTRHSGMFRAARAGSSRSGRYQRGFTLMEIGLALLVSVLVIASVLGAFSAQRLKSQVQETVTNMGALSEASFNWAGTKPNFTGISCTVLSTYGVLPPAVGQCTGANPWGGDYSVAPNAANAAHLDVTVTAVPASAGNQLQDKMSGQVTAATYNSGASTFTVTF